MSTFETLQGEVSEWSRENFADQPTANPLLGVAEELGELTEHLAVHDCLTEYELDCVGDLLVYLADFCARRGFDLQAAYDTQNPDERTYDDPLYGVNAALGRLNRSVLKRRQGIRLEESRVGDEAERRTISTLLTHLSDFAKERGYTLEECIDVAWYEEVSDREWESSYRDCQ
ncbi:MazG-like family protein [Natronobacterium gregoryi]|uniref:Uncharacterized protein n=2 Tax=Natronobacterium gregoryi TaxID=44930 RepID=L0ANW8_NATGS|nr:MazG-like family protein [Natronobacterium gregoryi]AFZ74775.1 hypothetical protein Natgr_3665 [Natronobacterium gregoryi SP2]ELY73554.1 hypothetical protein C490_01100 [Natronobacterium gregoryi SP2]PLK19418.1 hypothetical protein CYV19_14995 [Natronobacterium gregoryi SP2]SFJ49457.1 hypothetical protein SAMN05443661_13413 [Natronobacterium gregoryi]